MRIERVLGCKLGLAVEAGVGMKMSAVFMALDFPLSFLEVDIEVAVREEVDVELGVEVEGFVGERVDQGVGSTEIGKGGSAMLLGVRFAVKVGE